MLRTRPFAHNPNTGAVSKWYHYDDDTDEVYIEDVVDYAAYAAYNREMAKANTGRFEDGMHWIGSIDPATHHRLKERGVLSDQKAFRRWWNSDESAPFRGRDMRL